MANQFLDFRGNFRSHERCMYLVEGLARIFGNTTEPQPSSKDIRPVAEELPGLRRVAFSFARFFVSAIAMYEPRRISQREEVRMTIARTIVQSFSEIEYFFFALASGVSVCLHAKNDPMLTTILRDEDLFRKSFHADRDSEQFSLAELEATTNDIVL